MNVKEWVMHLRKHLGKHLLGKPFSDQLLQLVADSLQDEGLSTL